MCIKGMGPQRKKKTNSEGVPFFDCPSLGTGAQKMDQKRLQEIKDRDFRKGPETTGSGEGKQVGKKKSASGSPAGLEES